MTGPDVAGTDAVILCGGLGTRLRGVIGEKQKTAAAVNGRPFLFFLIKALRQAGVRRVILAVGYQAAEVRALFAEEDLAVEIVFSEELTPKGTGGALWLAQGLIRSDPFFVLNGDSFCRVDYSGLLTFHQAKKAAVTLTVSPPKDRGDYGSVRLASDQQVTDFVEKEDSSTVPGVRLYVNAGVYCFSAAVLAQKPRSETFSLEKDFFPRLCGQGLFGYVTAEGFWDIGTPQRYQAAQEFFRKAG